MLTNQAFRNPQGQSFTDAVVLARQIVFNRSWNGNERASIEHNLSDLAADPVTSESDNSNETKTISVEFVYWPDQASYDAGLSPYVLMNTDSGTPRQQHKISSAELAKEKYSALELTGKAELYFTDVLVPSMTTAG